MTLLLLSVLFFPAAAQAKGEKPAAPPREAFAPVADRILQPAMWQKRLPGLVVGVVKEGRIVITKGYGVKSFESGGVPDENTVFFIGSLSKAITAVGAMLLVEHGKLDLNAPASKYLKGLPKNWQGITVAQFMAHQSGIPQLNRKLPTFDQMLRSADGVPLSFPPGIRQEYNNFNFAVVGKVIEAVSGMSYLDYMKRTVFGPLRMDHTGTDLRGRNVATAYRPAGRELRPIEHRIRGGAYGIPSGHLQSTLADLLKLHEAFRTGKLLKPATYEQMIARINPTLSGTPGWFEQKAGRYSVVTKNGATQGFHSVMSFVPGKGDAVVLLWTSQKPKGNGLGMVKNRLLERICNVAVRGEVEPTAGRDDE